MPDGSLRPTQGGRVVCGLPSAAGSAAGPCRRLLPWWPAFARPGAGSSTSGARRQGHRDGSSVVDCLDAKPLELFKVVAHVLEHLGGVRCPVQDLVDNPQWLPGAIGPRRVARELLVRQVGVILKGPVGSTR